jgi:hypothetical protein
MAITDTTGAIMVDITVDTTVDIMAVTTADIMADTTEGVIMVEDTMEGATGAAMAEAMAGTTNCSPAGLQINV